MSSNTERILETAVKQHLNGNKKAAIDLYNKVLSENPNNVTALVNYSTILMDLKNFIDATYLLERALHISPEDIEARNNYGNSLFELGNPKKAIQQLKIAQELSPENSTVSINLGRALLRQGDYTGAIKILESAILYNPDNAELRFINALALPIIPDSLEQLRESRNRQITLIRDLLRNDLLISDPIEKIGMTNFISAYHGLNDRELQNQLATSFRSACSELNYVAPHIGQKNNKKKIRIGFVSANFCSHTIGKLNRALISNLNRNEFEVFIFCLGTNKRNLNYLVDKYNSNVDNVIFLDPKLNAMHHKIAEKELDIIYYTDVGMEPLSYFLSFSRLAPAQCVTWGHPVSTGVSTIDYFISSKITEPKSSITNYTEKLILFNCFSTDYATPNIEKLSRSRKDFMLSETANLYFCPQSLFKFHPDFDQILGDILRGDPNGELILLEGQHRAWSVKLRSRFKERIPDVSTRIKFFPRLSGSDFFHFISLANVILDTPYFCGGNTSYEAFSLGKIIITLPGRYLRGRLTSGLYRQMGISAFIAKNQREYIQTAIKFGIDREAQELAEKRIRVANKAIFDNGSAIKAHEKFFLQIAALNSAN